ncbi:MAG: TfoX/Sxy family protein [Caulobacteraceae bacterium]
MAWTKSPQPLVDLLAESLPDDRRIERRKMFGYPIAFVNGNMFAGLFGDQMFARLAPTARQALERTHGPLPLEPMPGRPMKNYTRVPDAILADEAAVADVLAGALAFTAALPAKVKKAKRKPAP